MAGRVLFHNVGGEAHEETWITSMAPMVAHGICMVLAWLFLINVGTHAARYLKKADPPLPEWFPFHVWSNGIGVTLSLVGLIFVVAHIVAEGSPHLNGLHQVAGLLLTMGMLLQAYLGAQAHYSWYEGKPVSPIDMWHWWGGRLLLVAATGECLLGLQLLVDEGMEVGVNVWLAIGGMVFSAFGLVAYYEVYYWYDREVKRIVKAAEGSELHARGGGDSEAPEPDAMRPRHRKRFSERQFMLIYGVVMALFALMLVGSMYFSISMPHMPHMVNDDDDAHGAVH
eukprot:CAMPEP_0119123124 /NCGR_PEP_ID=MMETSP1310-20130426/3166_1 /TAXON_ID=464262 /ORGANISM="Genus nov. species nov., Strain RCC2339" /LENGTH=282 /DNA_ID=CAMNT_0007112875 /DNA_START=53 /DNA_END=901 /DNA_ORIENTATION=+